MSEEERKMNPAVKAIAEREGKYLTFSLADEEYGIGILKIKEMFEMKVNEAIIDVEIGMAQFENRCH